MFRAIPGVLDAVCVYVGGKAPWPTYECIYDYTEGVTVVFDPDVLSFEELLEIFLGKVSFTRCSSSTQYMSGIWWHTSDQENIVQTKIRAKETEIGTGIPLHRSRAINVYRAEEYHQRFFEKNGKF